MKALVVNQKNQKTEKVKIDKQSIDNLRDIALSVAATGKAYSISVIAETAAEVDFISTNFHNLPLPAAPASRAIWTGDLATFILLNYPKDI